MSQELNKIKPPKIKNSREQENIHSLKVLDLYNKIIIQWKKSSKKMIINYDKHNEIKTDDALVIKYNDLKRICSEHESKWDIITNYVTKLFQQKTFLLKNKEYLEKEIKNQKQDINAINDSYNDLNDKIKNVKMNNLDDIQIYKDNLQMINKIGLTKYNKKCHYNTLNFEYKSNELYLSQCELLIKEYYEYQQNMSDKLKTMETNIKQKWDEFESIWDKWTLNDVLNWFKSQNIPKNSNINWDNILHKMKQKKINGQTLPSLSNNDLHDIGLIAIPIQTIIMKSIHSLTIKHPKKNVNKNPHNKHPNKYICPLSGKLMIDPVIAYDTKTYERQYILKLLKQQNKNLYVFPNNKLKKEIQCYMIQNDIKNS